MDQTPAALRVCIVAENASFRFGGEASLPLHYFLRLRKRGIEAWLVVHGRTREELQALLPGDEAHIRFIPDQWFHRLLWQSSRYLPRRISEATFGALIVLINQYLQKRLVRDLVEQQQVHIIHQPIPVSPRMPSLMAGFGVPVIIGPMNGGMEYPAAFRKAESLFTRLFIQMGRGCANFVNRVIPGKRKASMLLVANDRTRQALPSCAGGLVVQVPENGVDLKTWEMAEDGASRERNKFIFVGRLVDWKRLDFVLEALALVPGAELEVIGDGPMRAEWQARSEQLGIGERVSFIGWLPQQECGEHLRSAVALLLPSIYECGGAVVLEAMACGIPAVATDWGGPADYLDPSCGVLVPSDSPASMVQGFAEAMQRLMDDEPLCRKMGEAGRRKVEAEFDWDKKIDRMLEFYRLAIQRR